MRYLGKRAVVVTPVFPMPENGADQSDRAHGIRQLKRLGFEVTVISKVGERADHVYLSQAAQELGVKLVTVPYKYTHHSISLFRRALNHLGKLRNPMYLDGAAYEYTEPAIQKALENEFSSGKVDLAWFDYTYLWPLYHVPLRYKVPIVTRAMNFEPTHYLEEDGTSVGHLFRYVPKLMGELRIIRLSNLLLTLSPHEDSVYRRWGASRTAIIPLRGLGALLRNSHSIRTEVPLHVSFVGSTYTVAHNERALDLVTGSIALEAEKRFPGQFVFHVSGSKMPEKYKSRFDGYRLKHEGFVPIEGFDAYMSQMDIAIAPSEKHVGMQQKVYEPLARGIPLITHRINVGAYPFKDRVHYMSASSVDEYVEALGLLRDPVIRKDISSASSTLARTLFSQESIDATLQTALETYIFAKSN